MIEKLMQYIWQTGLWGRGVLTTVDGHRVEIIDRGQLNTASGPDFFNAKIKIGDTTWAGNIECHVRASDWHRHGHDDDPAYDNVILHVVAADDCAITLPGGREVPQVVMENITYYHNFYDRLIHRDSASVPCAEQLSSLSQIEVAEWLGALGFERLHRKVGDIATLLTASHGDWAETAYIILARALGFGANADPMERVARSVPMKVLSKHSDQIYTLEAILLGQASLIDTGINALAPGSYADDYHRRLSEEYAFMAKKFSLTPVNIPGWKVGAVRPGNSPWRRLALLAALVRSNVVSGSRLFEVKDVEHARRLFDAATSDYWQSHWRFGATSTAVMEISRASRDILIINAVVPLMYARGEATADYHLMARATTMLQDMLPERNAIVRQFDSLGIVARDALDSQALIELYKVYCQQRRCISCRFAHRLLAKSLPV